MVKVYFFTCVTEEHFVPGQHARNQNGDALSKYRRRSGDCSGGDISGHDGVGNATACAEKCDKLVECVGFVYTKNKSACYLKLVSCVKTSPKAGATMYDIIGTYLYNCYEKNYSVYNPVVPSRTASCDLT